jgi:hypothetical protein
MAMCCTYCEWLSFWSRTGSTAIRRGGIVDALTSLLQGSSHSALLMRKGSVAERDARLWLQV